MTFDRLQLLHDVIAQVDQSQLVEQGPLQEFHPAAITAQQLEQLQVFAADVQQLRDAIMQAGPSPALHQATIRRHVAEAPRIWGAITTLLPPARLPDSAASHFELTATGRAALDTHQGA